MALSAMHLVTDEGIVIDDTYALSFPALYVLVHRLSMQCLKGIIRVFVSPVKHMLKIINAIELAEVVFDCHRD